ncbi:MAG: GntR family transcriptional regulator [Candidatus Rokubacteria bacterium]|nr:GntR family transcriptional regulator [Candidatus Rokubacteria bacterium]
MPNELRPSIFEDVIRKIRRTLPRARSGRGSGFLSERSLAALFRVNGGSIREAIRALELFGLVRRRRVYNLKLPANRWGFFHQRRTGARA